MSEDPEDPEDRHVFHRSRYPELGPCDESEADRLRDALAHFGFVAICRGGPGSVISFAFRQQAVCKV